MYKGLSRKMNDVNDEILKKGKYNKTSISHTILFF